MRISKKFFRLRRKGAKRRETGYYQVRWSYGNGLGSVWRIGFYSSLSDSWVMPGDPRFFKDADFIAINENEVLGFFSRWPIVNFFLRLALIELIFNAGYIVYLIIEHIYKLTK